MFWKKPDGIIAADEEIRKEGLVYTSGSCIQLLVHQQEAQEVYFYHRLEGTEHSDKYTLKHLAYTKFLSSVA